MKVVVVNNLYTPNVRGGAERSVQLLAEALVRLGSEVTVVATHDRAGDPIEVGGVKVVTLASANVCWPFGEEQPSAMRRKLFHLIDIYNPWVTGPLVQLIQSEKPDVVHTNNLQGISVAAWHAAAVAGVPVVHTLRDYYLACARSLCFRDGRNCARTCLECLPFCSARRRLSAGVAGVVGTSRFILGRHLDLGFFAGARLRGAIENPCARVRRARGRGAVVRFGYLGRLEEAKGIELALSAFSERRDEGWELLVAGSGTPDFVAALRRRAAGAGRPQHIRFVGWANSTDFLAQVDVVVVPSLWHEPFARAAIEAQACGVAIIASRRGGLSELVDDGVEGLLFEPDEPRSLTQAINRLVEDPSLLGRMGDAAFARAARYDPDTVARQYGEAYNAAIAASRGDAQ